MPKVDWNAPELYYILQYRKVKDASSGVWKEENITDPTIGIFSVRGPGQYEVWQFRICAVNDEGLGRFSAIEKSYFGQDAPIREPENVGVGRITASSVKISWTPVADSKVESIDGYMVSSSKLLFCFIFIKRVLELCHKCQFNDPYISRKHCFPSSVFH